MTPEGVVDATTVSHHEGVKRKSGSEWWGRDIGRWGTLAKSLIGISALLGFLGAQAHDDATAWGFFAPAVALLVAGVAVVRFAPQQIGDE
jgi:hypothetical protein